MGEAKFWTKCQILSFKNVFFIAIQNHSMATMLGFVGSLMFKSHGCDNFENDRFFCGGWHTIANLNRNKKVILVGGSSAHLTLSFAMPPKPSDPRFQALMAMDVSTDVAVLFCPFWTWSEDHEGTKCGIIFQNKILLLWNAPLWKKSATNKTTDYARSWKMSPLHKPI